ncbi:atherin-like [Panicum miliaceum]|uniref:Atherin-like n=1 Tax=Panicum miliaceum TaxID=4540 RepID=A0A3L6RS69_PANMI|nr:atherin-like [Panicum miliaceum]
MKTLGPKPGKGGKIHSSPAEYPITVVFRLLLAAILILVAGLTPEDQRVLAHLVTRSFLVWAGTPPRHRRRSRCAAAGGGGAGTCRPSGACASSATAASGRGGAAPRSMTASTPPRRPSRSTSTRLSPPPPPPLPPLRPPSSATRASAAGLSPPLLPRHPLRRRSRFGAAPTRWHPCHGGGHPGALVSTPSFLPSSHVAPGSRDVPLQEQGECPGSPRGGHGGGMRR